MKFSSDLFKFENSRFFNDKRIPKKTSINLKQKWLNNFLSGTNIVDLDLSRKYPPTYNHTTILKTILNKLKEINV